MVAKPRRLGSLDLFLFDWRTLRTFGFLLLLLKFVEALKDIWWALRNQMPWRLGYQYGDVRHKRLKQVKQEEIQLSLLTLFLVLTGHIKQPIPNALEPLDIISYGPHSLTHNYQVLDAEIVPFLPLHGKHLHAVVNVLPLLSPLCLLQVFQLPLLVFKGLHLFLQLFREI